MRWKFDGKSEPGVSSSSSSVDGPRPPQYPGFSAKNTALSIPSAKQALTIRERDVSSARLRFENGETITLEAWVRAEQLPEGQFVYLLGKGRNHKPGFPEKNQNYALRLKSVNNEGRITFLFSSRAEPGHPADWHRWTSNAGFTLNTGWHHVAVSYTFGQPKSIRGIVDGRIVNGTWDMGGATTRPPVVDADDLTIGTGNGGSIGNTFIGSLDEVAVWRGVIPTETLTQRYQFIPPPPAIAQNELRPGAVLVQLCEHGMPARNAWPELPPAATETYTESAFGFFEVPHKYVDTGVRGDRPNPFLLRAAAAVPFPAGKHRLLLRARGASRLYLDGKLILTTTFPPSDNGGHGHVRDPKTYLNLGPDFRFAPPGNREEWTTLDVPAGEHVVMLETIVGGFFGKSNRRPELGETVAAISPEGSESWFLLTPGKQPIPYTDAGWAAYRADREHALAARNSAARAATRSQHAGYWNRRREAAKQWLQSTPETPVPALPAGFPAHNPIDHFLAAKLAHASQQMIAAKRGSVSLYDDVLPILETRCFSCHSGGKVQGGLKLDSRAGLLAGGKLEGPAIVPGKPAESPLLARIQSAHEDERMPPKGERLSPTQVTKIATWVREGALWPEVRPEPTALTPLTDDLTFLRRVTLDTVGVAPTSEEIQSFLAEPAETRRTKAIDRLLADPRWADHGMGYWLDVLAENPNILNPTLNNTGPFRWWLYESLLDNKPLDLFVTELIRMNGSERYGGPAGFATATQNDVPFAAKGVILTSAFLGIQTQCARCHDAPSHRSTQEDLFHIAAMLARKPQTVPATSSVPLDKIHEGGRTPLIQVTLKPGTAVAVAWSYTDIVSEDVGRKLAEHPDDSRDRLAAILTAPQNERFAQVLVNRLWQRYMGRGLVDPIDDWEKGTPSHPELLRWLARELVRNGYDQKQIARLILTSHAYQRATDTTRKSTGVLYASPAPRRLTAEQIVDALFAATGKPFRVEEASLDIDGQRAQQSSITLGQPRRSWMLTSTSNERDRPSLALPRIQAVADVLTAFGWRGSRQEAVSVRDTEPNTLQPAILSNGTMGVWLTRLSDDHGITTLALREQSLDQLVDVLFLKLLTRHPTTEERSLYTEYLRPGYESRVRPAPTPVPVKNRLPEPYVSWSNHLAPEATTVRMQQEQAARRGDPPTERLDANWRNRMEDVLWALLNSPEFIFTR
ncbi:MAG: DUF1553 domain-containing protein [Bacteroidales bacterium]|nr:DUF1553 domain-containing protein [Bacteroidales bacterium]